MDHGAWSGRNLRSTKEADSKTAGEYTGVEGMIQPAPHDPEENSRDTHEQLWLLYNTDPGARATDPDATGLPVTEPAKIRDYGG